VKEGFSTQKNPRTLSYFLEKYQKIPKIPKNSKKSKNSKYFSLINRQNDQESTFFVIDSNSPYFLLLGFCLPAIIGIFMQRRL
jgi:hypothetical protein